MLSSAIVDRAIVRAFHEAALASGGKDNGPCGPHITIPISTPEFVLRNIQPTSQLLI
jgi:hypothetical protein